ncbi:MAG: hypothetical protein ACRD0W_02320 [Acidimicrobiales bacterium]
MTNENDATTPTEAPRPRRRWLWPVATGVALLAGVGIGQAGAPSVASDGSTPAAEAQSESEPSAQEEAALEERAAELDAQRAELDALAATLEQREADIATRESAATAAEETVAASAIPGEGLFVVGEDISAGEYKTSGPSGNNIAGCYYAFMSDTSATAEIVDNNILQGQGRVTLSDGDVFETSGCADWTLTN